MSAAWYVLGLVCLSTLIAVVLFAVAGARYVAAGALGMRGIRLFFGGAVENPEAAAAWKGALVVLAGILASYLVAASLFSGVFLVSGRALRTTEVTVTEGRPAAQAGMETGDRVLSVGGAPVAEWVDLIAAIASHAGQSTEIVVARGEENVRLTVTPLGAPNKGRIGVASLGRLKRAQVGVGGALARGIASPALVLGELATLHAGPELAGPGGERLHYLATLAAYLWPLAAVTAIATVPRRKRVPAEKRPRPQGGG
jgi:membrane-associated protease RseP (regulator of RpoE activity)